MQKAFYCFMQCCKRQKKNNEMENGDDKVNLDLGLVRSSASLSYFANLIQALQHPVNAPHTYNSGMAVHV